MDEILDFFSKPYSVVELSGPATKQDPSLCSVPSEGERRLTPDGCRLLGTSYAVHAKFLETENAGPRTETDETEGDCADEMETIESQLFDSGHDDVFDKYRLGEKSHASYKIDNYKTQILHNLEVQNVTIIEGPTGCGKTTQVPFWILEEAFKKKFRCNIVTTQPRRIAATTVARQVCRENNFKLGDLIGYQVGLDKKTSQDTRLTFVTTGVLLQSLVRSKSLNNYTHIILDEVHEREKDMDFLMIIIKKLMKRKSNRTKLILMSATFNIHKFFDYFFDLVNTNVKEVSIVTVKDDRKYPLSIHYLDELSKIGQLPETRRDQPTISKEGYEFCVKLLCVFERIDKIEEKDYNIKRPSILIFLPGFSEIEELYCILDSDLKRKCVRPDSVAYKWFLVPLHSCITSDEQAKAFINPPNGYRKIILATNIAESSITVPDVKYVVDFCLAKMLFNSPVSGFSSLQNSWASQNSCQQRAGRAGRTRPGRVYRLVLENFFHNLDRECSPEIQRTSLERLILNTKLLNMGSPKNILGLAMDPPDLSYINKTVLLLKETGGLFNSTSPEKYCDDDDEITYIGRLMAKLPLDIRVSKLILLGYMFGCLEDCIIMGAAISGRNIFSSPFLERMCAYNSKLTWSYGSTSDCIAFLNVYKVYSTWKKTNEFSRFDGGEEKWAKTMYLQLKALHDLDKLIGEIKQRLEKEGIIECAVEQGEIWSNIEKNLILKMVLAGAFYPHFFVLHTGMENGEREFFKILNGKDPYNTVYLTNMDNQQPGPLYTSQIKAFFRNNNMNDVDVEFDSNSRKVFVSCSSNSVHPEFVKRARIPGKAELFVYQAMKLKQLRIPIVLNVMSIEKSLEQYNAFENHVLSESGKDLNFLLSTMAPFLPGIDETFIVIKISQFENCSRFWANNNDESTLKQLKLLNKMLNSPGVSLHNLTTVPQIGRIYAAFDKNEPFIYKRAKVTSINCLESVDVYFIDYGNSCSVSTKSLKELNPKLKELFKIPPLCFECTLAEIAPSVLKDSRGYWTKSAISRFHDLTINKKLHAKVYSVVQSVVHMELFANNIDVNNVLVNEGYAQKAEESYLSKMNKDLRDRANNMQPSQVLAFNKDQIEKHNNPFCNYIVPNPNDCTEKIILKGPFSPLETNIYSVLSTGKNKCSKIDWDSVNSILLNTEPNERSERLLVAATVHENKDGSSLKLQNTTLMPNIPGLTELVTLIFCPAAELFCDANRDRYVGMLCGLGHMNGKPIFPEHDIFININSNITNEDLENINFLRKTMDFILKTTKGEETLNIDGICRAKALQTIKKILQNLLSRPRKQFEPVPTFDPWSWSKRDESMMSDSWQDNDFCIFPPHAMARLRSPNPEWLLKMARKNAKIHEICKGSFDDGKTYSCEICKTDLLCVSRLRLHLQTKMHKDNEADLPSI